MLHLDEAATLLIHGIEYELDYGTIRYYYSNKNISIYLNDLSDINWDIAWKGIQRKDKSYIAWKPWVKMGTNIGQVSCPYV